MTAHKLHCNNRQCQDRSNCQLGNKYRYGDRVVYGLGSNSSECPSFVSKNIEVVESEESEDGKDRTR
ncbi:hypothetical protein UFOVP136_19 [uncultured Caudovirales phage]|uniref:Uncharacterized protein n=1 Tax=uncultured Caudovirales phage TaxID=2100421 RepID=A0A6J5LGH0_9CAUD|nr:hypothetical protein UFOVP136_19 [uncultured Caudovirales phage]